MADNDLHLSSLSDEDLLLRVQRSGSHAAFSELVQRHADRFRGLAYRYTHSISDAEDIVQDAFINLWLKPQSWRPDKKTLFTTWFYRIVANRCLDRLRKSKPVPLAEDDATPDATPLADEALSTRQREEAVETAFRTLPPDMQTALNLSFYEPVPNQEAAHIMGLSLKAFQSLLMRAKTKLRDTVMAPDPAQRRSYG